MRFIVSSTDLLQLLLTTSRVIASKNSLPILDNFLFRLDENKLTVTASDMETTIRSAIQIEEVAEEGEIAVPAKLLTDAIKELPTQPIEFSTNADKQIANIVWQSGNAQIPFLSAEEYPQAPALKEAKALVMSAKVLADGINGTIYATAEEELRPVMNGIFFDITEEDTTLVASNAHKLVCFIRNDIKLSEKASFILPKKPANILRGALAKLGDTDVVISFDNKNACFTFAETTVVCRLVEGTFPAYRSIIPKNNTNVITVSRTELLNASKRVAVCSSQATAQIIFRLSMNRIEITAQDVDFSTSAKETLLCNYEGVPMEISFKSTFLIEILSSLPYDDICIKLSDSNRAALIEAAVDENPDEAIRALLMPMRIN